MPCMVPCGTKCDELVESVTVRSKSGEPPTCTILHYVLCAHCVNNISVVCHEAMSSTEHMGQALVARQLVWPHFGSSSQPTQGVLLALLTSPLGGVFAQRAHSAGTARAQCAHSANYYGDYPGNNPENHPPVESCTTNSNLKNSNI